MRQKITKLVNSFLRLPLPMQLIILASVVMTILAALSIEAYQRYAAAQRAERQALWRHINGGKPPNPQTLKRLSGLWFYKTEQRRARLRMTEEGIFQLIANRRGLTKRRAYIRGYYSVRDQTLYLRQDDRFGRPYIKGQPEVRFTPMTLREASVRFNMDRNGQRMTWLFSETERTRDIQKLQENLATPSAKQVQWYKAR